ncbi:MAG: VWA domain-containing protein [Gammaproteobacteria bacterium]
MTAIQEFFQQLQFARPLLLWLLPLSLLLLTLGLRLLGRSLQAWSALYTARQQVHYRHPLAALLTQIPAAASERPTSSAPWRSWLAYAVLLSLLHLALAQPYRLGEKLPEPPPYRDIIFLVDTSVSMMLRDYLVEGQRTDRMSMVKSVLQHFITDLSGSRLGLVAFSEQAYTLVPLTTDHALLRTQLQRLQPASLTGRRSDPGKAILYTLNELEAGLQRGEKPVLVMLTDANRPVRQIDPRSAAALLRQQGLHLHLIAMGAASMTAKEEDTSSLIYQPADVRLLQDIASAAGGRFFRADSHASLNQVLAEIQAGAQQVIVLPPVYIQIPLYHWPLLLALVWLWLWQLSALLRGRT